MPAPEAANAAVAKGKTMSPVMKLRQISPQEFATLGMQAVAYVKRITVNDTIVFAIHAADGTQLAVLPDRDTAFATVRQNDIEPVSVH
jgi:hypothetical protein